MGADFFKRKNKDAEDYFNRGIEWAEKGEYDNAIPE